MAAKKKTAIRFDAKTGYPFTIGDCILIRTVTMYQLGRVVHIGPDSITLDDASWIADVGKLSVTLRDGVPGLNEVEKCPSWACIGRGAIVDIFAWVHELPGATK